MHGFLTGVMHMHASTNPQKWGTFEAVVAVLGPLEPQLSLNLAMLLLTPHQAHPRIVSTGVCQMAGFVSESLSCY
jgi:hypothetical protein